MKKQAGKSKLCNLPLQAIRVRHFKAVRDSGLVRFTPLTVFIGNNASGKSSLIEALETIRTVAIEGLDEAFSPWRGFEHIWNKSVSHALKENQVGHLFPANPMSFEISGSMNQLPFHGDFQLAIDTVGDRVAVTRQGFSSSVDQGSSEEPQSALEHSIWRSFVRGWQFLNLNPQAMLYPQLQRRSQVSIRLAKDGSNIAQYLLSMADQKPDILLGIGEALRTLMPYVSDVRPAITRELERSVYLRLDEEGIDKPIISWLLSQGTLRLVAFLAVFRDPQPPTVVFIEELENGLDPRSIHVLIEEMRQFISMGGQVIATTHSPFLLDLLDLAQIIVVERDKRGAPVFRRPSKGRLKGWTDNFTPGRLYTIGSLTKG
jgi:predicted ATPase